MSSSQSMAHDEAMHRYEEQYDALKAKLQAVGFIGQGSVQTRRIACGSPTCRCHHDPDARHGPYHYWTRKARGKTVGLKLTEDELGLYSVTGCGTDFLQWKWAEMDRAVGEVAA